MDNSVAKTWEVENAWVGWYGRDGLGLFKDYHPQEADKVAPGTCLVTTCVNQDQNGRWLMNLKTSTCQAADLWHPVAKLLLETAVFYFDEEQNVMSSEILDIKKTAGDNPFDGFYDHVKFDITLAFKTEYSKKVRVFTTQATWLQTTESDKADITNNQKVEILSARSTSYAWKDPK